jgi:hypothetical protein
MFQTVVGFIMSLIINDWSLKLYNTSIFKTPFKLPNL